MKNNKLIQCWKIKSRKDNGFTLVEILVAVTIFTLLIGVVAGLFVYILQSQKRALVYQEVFSQTSFIMEYMVRGIRMAKKQKTAIEPINPQCVFPVEHNYEVTLDTNGNPNHLKFIKWDHLKGAGGDFVCYEFFLDGTTLKISKDGVVSSLTSPKLDVKTLRFEVKGDGIELGGMNMQLQPRITIVLEIKGEEGSDGRRPTVHLQTTISQRDLDD